jgi:hypothetical protein
MGRERGPEACQLMTTSMSEMTITQSLTSSVHSLWWSQGPIHGVRWINHIAQLSMFLAGPMRMSTSLSSSADPFSIKRYLLTWHRKSRGNSEGQTTSSNRGKTRSL